MGKLWKGKKHKIENNKKRRKQRHGGSRDTIGLPPPPHTAQLKEKVRNVTWRRRNWNGGKKLYR